MTNPNPDPAKHKEIPIWNAENWLYEDFEVGQRARSIRRTISEGESMLFNAIVLDMHPYVGDDVFAREEGIFGRRLVAGSMVFSLGLGLMAHNNVHTFSYGYDKLRFISRCLLATLFIQLEPTWKSGLNIQTWEWLEFPTKPSRCRESWFYIASSADRQVP